MFMVSASGTACVVKYKNNDFEKVDKPGVVAQNFIDFELKRQSIILYVNNGNAVNSACEEFLYEHPQIEIVEKLIDTYIKDMYAGPDEKAFIRRYLSILPKSEIVDYVYSKYLENAAKIELLIKESQLLQFQ